MELLNKTVNTKETVNHLSERLALAQYDGLLQVVPEWERHIHALAEEGQMQCCHGPP